MPSRNFIASTAARTLCVAAAVFLAPAAGATSLRVGALDLEGTGDVGRHDLRRIATRVEADLAVTADFLGATDPIPRVHITVYQSIEAKGLATGYTLPVHSFTARRDVHYAREPGFEGDLALEVVRLALRDRLGRPRVEALETGLAAGLVVDWRGRGALYWAARLGALDDLDDVALLVDNRRFHRESRLIMTPVAAAFVSFLVGRWGREEFLARYPGWQPQDVDSLRAPFGEFLRGLHERESRRDVAPALPELPAFQRGFCYAHEGYQIHNGYGSATSDAALAKLAAMGANAVSITPFTYMRSARRPEELPFSNGAGSENDECVIHAIRAARATGMMVVLKPHVWMRGSWPGEIEMASEGDWDVFFDHYYHWIRHYALMSEMVGAEVLCIGVEMSRTTMVSPERWRTLVERLRTVYRGRIAYAANWGEEFETIDIWDALDYVAVNCYYPLSGDPEANDDDLLAGANAALDRIEAVGKRWGKPVIVTEVGFTSSPTPWVEPHRRDYSAAPDPAAQARCYRAFLQALAGRDEIVGIYWWKWPSDLALGGSTHSGFTPNNKPAEDVVRRWFGRLTR